MLVKQPGTCMAIHFTMQTQKQRGWETSLTKCEQRRQGEQTQPHKTRVAGRWLRLTRTRTTTKSTRRQRCFIPKLCHQSIESDGSSGRRPARHPAAVPSIDRKRRQQRAAAGAPHGASPCGASQLGLLPSLRAHALVIAIHEQSVTFFPCRTTFRQYISSLTQRWWSHCAPSTTSVWPEM
jgi:hypothetical protein